MSKTSIVWANDIAGIARHILEVAPGLACNCTCPGCSAKLEAVNSRNPRWRKRPHFRHHDAPELEECAQSAVLAAARTIVTRAKELKLPAFSATEQASGGGRSFVGTSSQEAEVVPVEAVEFVDAAAAILTLGGGQTIRVRLVATTRRLVEPSQLVLGEIAIDISDPVLRSADPEVLRRYITLDDTARTWCHYHNEERVRQQARDDANRQLQDFLTAQATLPSEPDRLSAPFPTSAGRATQQLAPTPITTNHVSVDPQQIRGIVTALTRRKKALSCCWTLTPVDSAAWAPLVENWKIMFRGLHADLIDVGLKARANGEVCLDALDRTATEFGFTHSLIFGLWQAAGIACSKNS